MVVIKEKGLPTMSHPISPKPGAFSLCNLLGWGGGELYSCVSSNYFTVKDICYLR